MIRIIVIFLALVALPGWGAPVEESKMDDLPIRVRLDSALQLKLQGQQLRIQGSASEELKSPVEIRMVNVNGKKAWSYKTSGGSWNYQWTPSLQLSGSVLKLGPTRVPNELTLIPANSATSGALEIQVIGVLSLRDYLVGVVSSEVPQNWPEETIKAQAIVARSYAYSQMQANSLRSYDVEASHLDQVFKMPVETSVASVRKISRALEAVLNTSNLALWNLDGAILKAYYHSDCGGQTTSSKQVWGGEQDEPSVSDPMCLSRKSSSWTLKIPHSELVSKIQKKFGIEEPLIDLRLKLQVVGELERVRQVEFYWGPEKQRRQRSLGVNEFRQLMGFTHLKSGLFSAVHTHGLWLFAGRGAGHGVGFCQWGAREWGNRGLSYREILKHYYPFAELGFSRRKLSLFSSLSGTDRR